MEKSPQVDGIGIDIGMDLDKVRLGHLLNSLLIENEQLKKQNEQLVKELHDFRRIQIDNDPPPMVVDQSEVRHAVKFPKRIKLRTLTLSQHINFENMNQLVHDSYFERQAKARIANDLIPLMTIITHLSKDKRSAITTYRLIIGLITND